VNTRIFGLRNEYSVVFPASGQRQLSQEEARRRLCGPVASGGQANDVLFRNGGRPHLKAAGRPGYSTPQSGSAPELVVHDKAGERITEGLLADAGRRPREEGDADDISVLKTSAGPASLPYGCQEDYLIPCWCRRARTRNRLVTRNGSGSRPAGRTRRAAGHATCDQSAVYISGV
jgi:proteasome accessory factor A